MEIKKKPFYKRWWFILIAVVFIIGALGNIFESEEAKQEREDEKIAAEQKKEKEQKEKEAEKQKEKKAKKEEEERKANRTINEVLEEDNKNVDEAKLDDGILTLKSEPGGLWSENSLFHTVYDLFEAMNDGFKDDSVDEVEAIVLTTMVDNKGNESVDPVINYTYTRESFEELNYDKFANMAYGQQWRILNESNSYWIHPGIYKNLKDDIKGNLSNGMARE